MALTDTIQATSPTSYWTMGDAASTTTMAATVGSNGTYNFNTGPGATGLVVEGGTCLQSQIVAASGVAAYGAGGVNGASVVTLSAFVYMTANSNADKVFFEYGAAWFAAGCFGIFWNSTLVAGKLAVFMAKGAGSSNWYSAEFDRPSAGAAHHVRFELDRTNTSIKFWLDGVLQTASSHTYTASMAGTTFGTENLNIGGRSVATTASLCEACKYQHVAIYAGAEVDAEQEAIYEEGFGLGAATTYTFTGPSDGARNAASTNFTVTPNNEFTGTITPSDGGAGGTFTPSSLTWSAAQDAKTFTYTPVSYGTKTLSTTNDGGLTDPSTIAYLSHTGAIAVAAGDLWFNGRDGTGTPDQTAFAELRITTDATTLKVTGTADIHGSYPDWDEIVVIVDGTPAAVQEFSANGQATFTYALGAGTKNIVVRGGLQSEPSGTVLGTYIDAFQLEGLTTHSVTAPAESGLVVVYGDSIAVGANATTPATQGWALLLRDAGRDVAVEAWGFRTLYDDAVDATARTAFAAYLAGYSPRVVYLCIGTNDYGLATWTAANFGTAYADLLDKIHADLPSAAIVCQTPIDRTTETANGVGSTMAEYRTAITTACGTRAWATLIDGTAILETTDLEDGVHPTTAGHAAYAAWVEPYIDASTTVLTATPSGLTVTLTSATPSGATDYIVYVSEDGVVFEEVEGIVISGAISYEYSNGIGAPVTMVAGGTYYFKLKYLADEVELGFSTTASATLTAGGGEDERTWATLMLAAKRHRGRR